jgi:hypothetical protein
MKSQPYLLASKVKLLSTSIILGIIYPLLLDNVRGSGHFALSLSHTYSMLLLHSLFLYFFHIIANTLHVRVSRVDVPPKLINNDSIV